MGRAQVILVDTHVVIWLAFDPGQLSRKARVAIDDARNKAAGLAISDITLLELATLACKGRIHLDISLESFLQESRVSVRCSTYEWQGVREGNGTSRDLSQRSSGSHHRSYGTGCRASSADCRPPDPSFQSGSGGLVRTLGNREWK